MKPEEVPVQKPTPQAKKPAAPKATTTKSTSTTETTGTFQATPVLRTGDPYKMTEASDRSTPKALPGQ